MARAKALLANDPLRRWNATDALDLYNIPRWGCGYFGVNDRGSLVVTPRGEAGGQIDMKELIDELTGRGISLPILLRFSDILRARIELICGAFNGAIKEYGYTGMYRGVYPIKVNQNRTVVEEIIEYGRPFHYGLEAGSKPELLAIMAIHQDEEALIVCNGYKDEEYIETALLASKMGRTVILVVEKPSEIDHIHKVAERLKIKPSLGIRARLSSRGAGRWEQSGGDFSKFGLSAAEMVDAVKKLKAWGQVDAIKLLHFHLGSQISAIKSIKNALREAGRLYVELFKSGCTGLSYLDVGGGLGVDYDGSQTNFASSMNYTVQEYANDVVYAIKEICDVAGVPHPTLVSESGRAVAAHHSVLVVNVLGVTEFNAHPPTELPRPIPPLVGNLWETYQGVSQKNMLESYHDAVEYKDQVLQLFNLGHLSLEHRVVAENLFWAICEKVHLLGQSMAHLPEELEGLEKALSDTYFCNFSMFQSVPDAWAVDQLFPIMPDPPAQRGADPARHAGRHHLRLRRQGRALHRPARRQARARAAPQERQRLLPRPVPGRRVPGDPGRPAQPVRRHQHRARLAQRRGRVRDQRGRRRRHRRRGAAVRRLLAVRPAGPAARQRRDRAPQEADHHRGVAAAHQPLPRGHDRLHVPGQGSPGLTARPGPRHASSPWAACSGQPGPL